MAMVEGKTLIGWGVVRETPRHFAGLFASQTEAQSRATQMGEGYIVRYGERGGAPDMFASADHAAYTAIAMPIFVPLPITTDDRRLEVVADWIDDHVAVGKEGF